jgi:hypothetical protein
MNPDFNVYEYLENMETGKLLRRMAGWDLALQLNVMERIGPLGQDVRRKVGQEAYKAEPHAFRLLVVCMAIQQVIKATRPIADHSLGDKPEDMKAVTTARLEKIRGQRKRKMNKGNVLGRKLLANMAVIEELLDQGASYDEIRHYMKTYHRIMTEDNKPVSKSYLSKFIKRHVMAQKPEKKPEKA